MRHVAAKQDLYPSILECLASGELRPGERLGEETLGMRWNLSRMPAREALIRLEHEGIVTRKPGSGTYIRKLDRLECMELYELRAAIECVIIRHVASIVTDEQLAELDELAQLIDHQFETIPWAEAVRLDQHFHERLAEMSGLRHAQRQLKHNALFARSFALGVAMNDRQHPLSTHDPIVEALRLRNPDRAVRAIQQHFDLRKLEQHFNEQQED